MNLEVIGKKGFFFKFIYKNVINVLFLIFFCRNAPFGMNLEVIEEGDRFFLNFIYKNIINVLFLIFFVGTHLSARTWR
jgi:hypothetical protein